VEALSIFLLPFEENEIPKGSPVGSLDESSPKLLGICLSSLSIVHKNASADNSSPPNISLSGKEKSLKFVLIVGMSSSSGSSFGEGGKTPKAGSILVDSCAVAKKSASLSSKAFPGEASFGHGSISPNPSISFL
jgi:hypothetical protein